MKQFCLSLMLLFTLGVQAQESSALNTQIEDLKKQVISLNRDLYLLEEDLLFPASTQVAVYLDMDAGQYFRIDAVELHLDDKLVASHLYTQRQANALVRGGVQKLYLGNLARGEHKLTAYFVGIGPHQREYKRAVSTSFTKQDDPKALQIHIRDDASKQQPEFLFEEL
ncbi:hypothetical protein [Bowmanella sp. JS7-9]|uniref:AraC family transcriptional regulator n=1 Tax=Pseudobowmanella zhangzhouensis TaxID=1537679 RepID=A0ABW1XM69_9ALTE|nr:hypothetical protein [Bowmanella sp. JS7-9]